MRNRTGNFIAIQANTVLFLFAVLFCEGVYSASYLYRDRPIPFLISRPVTTAFFSYSDEHEDRSGPFVNLTKETHTAKQKLDIKTKGWIYHPALMIFTLGLRPEFKQQTLEADTEYGSEDDTNFLGYSLDTSILQYKPYTLNLFAQKSRSDIARSLAADSATESSTYRANLLLKYQPFPTGITVERRNTLTNDLFRTQERSDSVRIDSRHKTERSKSTLLYENSSQDRSIDDFSYTNERDTLTLSNLFKVSDKSNLNTLFLYNDNSSQLFENTTTTLSSNLSVDHRENLSTYYNVRIEDRDEQGFHYHTKTVSARLSHLLYENLRTTLGANASNSDLTGGEVDRYGANLNFQYSRRIPWGVLSLNYGYTHNIEDDKRVEVFSELSNEPITLNSTVPEFLNNTNVDNASIVVTDTTGGIIYVEGVDYIVTTIGTSVIITRTLFGGIGDGQQVLVNYRFIPEPPAKTSHVTNTYGGRLKLWKNLTLFYQRTHVKEKHLSGTPPSELTDDTITRTGGQFVWKWSTTRVEWEDRDTKRTPYQRLTVVESLHFRPQRNLSFGVSASYNELKLKDTGEVSKGEGSNANLRWNIGTGSFSINAYTQKNKGVSQRSTNTGLISVYQWRFGAWNPSLRYSYINETNDISGDTRKRNALYFQIQRQFQ